MGVQQKLVHRGGDTEIGGTQFNKTHFAFCCQAESFEGTRVPTSTLLSLWGGGCEWIIGVYAAVATAGHGARQTPGRICAAHEDIAGLEPEPFSRTDLNQNRIGKTGRTFPPM